MGFVQHASTLAAESLVWTRERCVTSDAFGQKNETMNPQEPVLPDPDVPFETPSNPVEEPPKVDDVESYRVNSAALR
jgi:hypothetical protein